MGSFWHPTEDKILGCLVDGLPRSAYQIGLETGIEAQALWSCLGRCWKKGLVLRSEKPIIEKVKVFRGRTGLKEINKTYYLYIYNSFKNQNEVVINGVRFVSWDEKYLNKRRPKPENKARLILKFLSENQDKAFYSKEILKQ